MSTDDLLVFKVSKGKKFPWMSFTIIMGIVSLFIFGILIPWVVGVFTILTWNF